MPPDFPAAPAPPPTGPRWLVARPGLAALLLSLSALAVYLPSGRYFQTGDNAPAEALPRLILEERRLDFTDEVELGEPLPYWLVVRNQRVVSFYPIVAGLLNLPVNALAKWRGADLKAGSLHFAHWTACLVVAASVGAIYLALAAVCASGWAALLATLVYAFGTAAWSTGTQALWQHGPSLLFLGGALALLVRPGRWLPLAGLLLGLAVFNRPANLLFAAPLALFVLIQYRRSPRTWLAFLGLAAIPAAAMAWYSIEYHGSLLALGQGHGFSGRHAAHQTGFTGPLFAGLAGLLFSPARGLFVYSPVFLAAFPALLAGLRPSPERPWLRWLCLGALLDLLLFAKWTVWWGGYCFGYRMLTELVPALVLLLGLLFDRVGALPRRRRRLAAALLAPLAALSVWFNFLGARYFTAAWSEEKQVDKSPAALWDTSDTELARLQARFRAEAFGP